MSKEHVKHIIENGYILEFTNFDPKHGRIKAWYNNDHQLHRIDGPAEEYADGDKYWWINGRLNREDGPACEYGNGGYEWCKEGKRHRIGGPALQLSGSQSRVYYVEGKIHRDDGPAIEWTDGSTYWYKNGLLHKEDGPALEKKDSKWGWLGNDGWAYSIPSGIPNINTKEMGYFLRKIQDKTGGKEWWMNGLRHRENAPACEYSDGTKLWFVENKLHREDGPAVEWADGTVEFWINGVKQNG